MRDACTLPNGQVLFAFEEAIGFMIGPMFRDKDGIAAAAVMGELAAEAYARGSSVRCLQPARVCTCVCPHARVAAG